MKFIQSGRLFRSHSLLKQKTDTFLRGRIFLCLKRKRKEELSEYVKAKINCHKSKKCTHNSFVLIIFMILYNSINTEVR